MCAKNRDLVLLIHIILDENCVLNAEEVAVSQNWEYEDLNYVNLFKYVWKDCQYSQRNESYVHFQNQGLTVEL